ncbi:MAG: hypothetical protein WC910_11600, partial [Bacteroidales bacterium]
DKNQEDTEGVGAGIYDLSGMYIYVPSFFRKGRIKAGEMMFLPERKQFLPATEQWLSELREQQNKVAGDIVQKPRPIGGDGSAMSTRSGERQDPFSKTAKQMLHLAEHDTQGDLLDSVLSLGKKAAATIVDTLMDDTRFCNSMIKWYGAERLGGFLKEAAKLDDVQEDTSKAFEVVTPYSKEAAMLEGRELKAMYRDGFYIRTNKKKFAEVMRDEGTPQSFLVPGDMAEYDVLMPDGELQRMLVLGKWCNRVYGVKAGALVDMPIDTACVKVLQDDKDLDAKIEAIGKQIEASDVYRDEKADKPFACECSPAQIIIDPKKRTFIEHNIKGGYGARDANWTDDPRFSNHNTSGHLTAVLRDGATLAVLEQSVVIPTDARLLDAHPRTELETARISDVPYIINKTKQAGLSMSVWADGPSYIVKGDMGSTNGNLLNAVEHMVTKYDINPGEAKAICKEACQCQVKAFVKKAADAQSEALIAANKATLPYMDLTSQAPTITNEKPTEKDYGMEDTQTIVNNAVGAGVKEVFDVSVLKLLASTNRPFEEVEEYVKVNMKTLDSLCRLQFLLYWKMAEFEERYGASKMSELEETLINSIDTISDLTLFLRTRSVMTSTINERTDGNILDEGA